MSESPDEYYVCGSRKAFEEHILKQAKYDFARQIADQYLEVEKESDLDMQFNPRPYPGRKYQLRLMIGIKL